MRTGMAKTGTGGQQSGERAAAAAAMGRLQDRLGGSDRDREPHDFGFKEGEWFDVDGTELDIKERTGALCRPKR